ncbi:hypothetical protein CerSpe_273080 [Prunus speciosa]
MQPTPFLENKLGLPGVDPDTASARRRRHFQTQAQRLEHQDQPQGEEAAISTTVASAMENTIVVEDFSDEFEKPKTKEFIAAMKRWGLDRNEKMTFLMREVAEYLRLSSRNIGTLKMLTLRTLIFFDILNADKLILKLQIVNYLNAIYGLNYEGDDEDEEDEEGA